MHLESPPFYSLLHPVLTVAAWLIAGALVGLIILTFVDVGQIYAEHAKHQSTSRAPTDD